MKTDQELQRDVSAELGWDPAVKSTAIGVAVNDGVVTLTGHLDTFVDKQAAARAVRRVAGVKAVALEIDVRPAIPHRRNDTEIAASAEQALHWNSLIPADAIRVVVDHGHVTLEGEVEWHFQRRAAEAAVRPLLGVVDVRNQIKLHAKPQMARLAQRIEEALTRQALRESRQVRVTCDGSTVRLTGLINSDHERRAVESVAWSAPGVTEVINELVVA